MATRKRSKWWNDGNLLLFFLVLLFVFLIDRVTKLLAVLYLIDGRSIPLFFFSFHYSTNTGAAFGLLDGNPGLLLFLSLCVFFLIIYMVRKHGFSEKTLTVAFALMVGGALGNLLDRIFDGYVVDFLATSFWPSFNVADTALTIGVLIAVVCLWKTR